MDNIFFIPNTFVKSSINFDVNWGLLLLRIFYGTPCIFYILSWWILAIFTNKTAVVVALSLIILVNQFTITTIASLSFKFRSGPTTSILISCHSPSSVSNGWSSPAFFMYYTLFCWHFMHSWTYFLISLFIPSHQ